MSDVTIEICTVCGHVSSACLGHYLNPSILPGGEKAARFAWGGGGDGFVGPTARVPFGSEAHKEAVALPIRAKTNGERRERAARKLDV